MNYDPLIEKRVVTLEKQVAMLLAKFHTSTIPLVKCPYCGAMVDPGTEDMCPAKKPKMGGKA